MHLVRAQEEEREENRGAETGRESREGFFMALSMSSVGMWEAVLGGELSPFQGHRKRQIEMEGGELEYYNTLTMPTLP